MTEGILGFPFKRAIPPPTPAISLEAVMQKSTHVCHEENRRIHCARCHSNCSTMNKTKCKQWLATQCTAIGTSEDRPTPLPFEHVHVGKLDVHVSHVLCVFRGIFFCNKCGSVSKRTKLGYLAQQCSAPTQAGKNNLDRIRSNRPPLTMEWPTL